MTVATLIPQTELQKTKQQILTAVPPLRAEVDLLEVKTEEDYQKASALLTRILTSKRWWLHGDPTGKWKGIDAIIKPFREGLDGLYDLKNDGLKPHDDMEADVKAKMKIFKIADNKRIADEREAKEKEQRRLQQEIEAKQARVDAAKTPKMREKLIGQQMALQDEQKVVAKTKTVAVKAVGSSSRTVKKWVVSDLYAFVQGLIALHESDVSNETADLLSIELLQINDARMNALFKSNPDLVAQLPGIDVIEDVIIAGR
jgi:hypothetical protein